MKQKFGARSLTAGGPLAAALILLGCAGAVGCAGARTQILEDPPHTNAHPAEHVILASSANESMAYRAAIDEATRFCQTRSRGLAVLEQRPDRKSALAMPPLNQQAGVAAPASLLNSAEAEGDHEAGSIRMTFACR